MSCAIMKSDSSLLLLRGNQQSNPRFIYWLTALSCIGGFLFGYDTGIISGALVMIADDFDLNAWEQELVVSVTVGGAMIAACAAGPLCDNFGRKPVVLASSIVFILGSVCMAMSPSFAILLAGRLIVGLGVGSASMSMPVLVSEMSSPDIRGTLVTFINVAITGGQFLSSVVAGSLCTVPEGWRWMLGVAAVPAAIQFAGFLFMPESPRWLIQHDDVKEAQAVLRRLRGCDDVHAEYVAIAAAVQEEHQQLVRSNSAFNDQIANIKNVLWNKTTRRALLLGCLLQACQQLSGINTVMYYSATILKLAGFTHTCEAIWLSAAVSFCNLLGSCVGLALVDRVGRRLLTLTSLFFVTLMLLGLSICFYLAEISTVRIDNSNWPGHDTCSYSYCFDCVEDENCGFCSSDNSCVHGGGSRPHNSSTCSEDSYYGSTCPHFRTAGWLIFAMLCLYLLCFAPGMGPMPWCINSEIYPTSVRGVGNSISTFVNWTSNLAMSMTFLTLTNAMTKQGAFGFYASIALLFFVFFVKYLPETKGLQLEEIKEKFSDVNWGNVWKQRWGLDTAEEERGLLNDERYADPIVDSTAVHTSSTGGRTSVLKAVIGDTERESIVSM